jgi:hypothetical protein
MLKIFLLCFFCSAALADTTAPEIRDIEFSIDEFDVSEIDKAITITLFVFEEESEIDWAQIAIEPPSGIPNGHTKYVSFSSWTLTDEANVYSSSRVISFGMNSAPGQWNVHVSHIEDESKQRASRTSSSALAALQIPSFIKVTNTNDIDVTAPSLIDIEVSSTSVDLTAGDKIISVTLTAQDLEAEVDYGSLNINAPEGLPSSHAQWIGFGQVVWQATEEDGIYTATNNLILKQNEVAAGTWTFSLSQLRDSNNNTSRRLNELELNELGVTSSIDIINPTAIDVTPPSFHSIHLSTNYVDTNSGIGGGTLRLYSPDGENRSLYINNFMPSKDEDNIYVGTFTFNFDTDDISGVWYVELGFFDDEIGNYLSGYSRRKIVSSGFDPYIRVNVAEEDTIDLTLSVDSISQDVSLNELSSHRFSLNGRKVEGLAGELIINFTIPDGVSFASIGVEGGAISENSCFISATRIWNRCRVTTEDISQVSVILDTNINAVGTHELSVSAFAIDSTTSPTIVEINQENNSISKTLVTRNYPATLEDFDGDGVRDVVDLDDDSDGIPDSIEVELGLDSLSHDDGQYDSDGDGISNFVEYILGSNMLDGEVVPFTSGMYLSFDRLSRLPLSFVGRYELDSLSGIDGEGALLASFDAENEKEVFIRARGQMLKGQIGFAYTGDKATGFSLKINGDEVMTDSSESLGLGDGWDYYLVDVEAGFSEVELRLHGNLDEAESQLYLDALYIPMVVPLVAGDYDGDRLADLALRNPVGGYNYWRGLSKNEHDTEQFGLLSDDIPVSGDFDGDGKVDWAIRRRSTGTWYVKQSSNNEVISKRFGIKVGDIPVPADYDGDGLTDFAIRRPSTGVWYIILSGTNKLIEKSFGNQEGDIPVVADYDGDGKADIAIRRPSNTNWYVQRSSDNKVEVTSFGKLSTDIPVPSDYDGDGQADIAIRRTSNKTWYILQSSDQQVRQVRFGIQPNDIPVVSDYDGDGKADIAIRRSSNYMWFILKSSTDEIHSEEFGRSASLIPQLAPYQTRLIMAQKLNATKNQVGIVAIDDGHDDIVEFREEFKVSNGEFGSKKVLDATTKF